MNYSLGLSQTLTRSNLNRDSPTQTGISYIEATRVWDWPRTAKWLIQLKRSRRRRHSNMMKTRRRQCSRLSERSTLSSCRLTQEPHSLDCSSLGRPNLKTWLPSRGMAHTLFGRMRANDKHSLLLRSRHLRRTKWLEVTQARSLRRFSTWLQKTSLRHFKMRSLRGMTHSDIQGIAKTSWGTSNSTTCKERRSLILMKITEKMKKKMTIGSLLRNFKRPTQLKVTITSKRFQLSFRRYNLKVYKNQ